MDDNHGQGHQKMVTENTAATSSLLNQFILGQLKEKQCSNGDIGTLNGFVLPKLQVGDPKTNFVIPQLKLFPKTDTTFCDIKVTSLIPQPANENTVDDISEISGGIMDMQVNDVEESTKTNVKVSGPVIDLTAALSSVSGITVKTRQNVTRPVEDFQIPFIECDRQEKPTILLPINDTYTQLSTDASAMYNGKRLTTPSSFGRIICLNYKRTCPLPKINHCFKVKHKIQRFRFDTKSPDDIILATLNKYHRQY